MEVHKHPHHVTHKKKWTEYLLEFLMLFLAVYLGFVAENIREKGTERHKEKYYIMSMIKDLKTDTNKIADNQRIYKVRIDSLDAFVNAFDLIDSGYSPRLFKLLESLQTGYPDFIYTDATIQQLKNSGGFSVIENKDAIDSIMAYDAMVKKALLNENELAETYLLMLRANEELFNNRSIAKQKLKFNSINYQKASGDSKDFKLTKMDFLISHDPAIENKYYNKLKNYIWIMKIVKNINYKQLEDQATRLIIFLRKEYHLEN